MGSKIGDHSDVVGASPVGVAPTTSSFPILHLASMHWAQTTASWDEKHLNLGIYCVLNQRFYGIIELLWSCSVMPGPLFAASPITLKTINNADGKVDILLHCHME